MIDYKEWYLSRQFSYRCLQTIKRQCDTIQWTWARERSYILTFNILVSYASRYKNEYRCLRFPWSTSYWRLYVYIEYYSHLLSKMTSFHLLIYIYIYIYRVMYTQLGEENRVITRTRYEIIYGRIGLLISQLLLFVSAHDMIFIVFSHRKWNLYFLKMMKTRENPWLTRENVMPCFTETFDIWLILR